MPLVSSQSQIQAEVRWSYVADNTGFSDATQGDTLTFGVRPDGDELWAFEFTLDAVATRDVDLYATFATLVKESTFATEIRGGWITVTGDGGILRMEPHSVDPLNWPFGAGGYEVLVPGVTGAGDVWADGEAVAVSSSSRQWLLTNTGSAQITVRIVLYISGAVFNLDFSEPHDSGYLALL